MTNTSIPRVVSIAGLRAAWDEMVTTLWYRFDCPPNFPLRRIGTSKRKYREEQARIQTWMDSVDWDNVQYVRAGGAR